jgi:hypothetical protein
MTITRLDLEVEMDGDKGCVIKISLCGDIDTERFFMARTEDELKELLEAMVRDARDM